jgi:hypothetical protein
LIHGEATFGGRQRLKDIENLDVKREKKLVSWWAGGQVSLSSTAYFS